MAVLNFQEFLKFAETLPSLKSKQYYKIKAIAAINNGALKTLQAISIFVEDEDLWFAAKDQILSSLREIQQCRKDIFGLSQELIKFNPSLSKLIDLHESDNLWDAHEIPEETLVDLSFKQFWGLNKNFKNYKVRDYYQIQKICVKRHEAVTELIGLSLFLTEELWERKKEHVLKNIQIIHSEGINLVKALKTLNENILSITWSLRT